MYTSVPQSYSVINPFLYNLALHCCSQHAFHLGNWTTVHFLFTIFKIIVLTKQNSYMPHLELKYSTSADQSSFLS